MTGPRGCDRYNGHFSQDGLCNEGTSCCSQSHDRKLDRHAEGNPDGNLGGMGVDLEYLKFAYFRKANPPNFQGTFNINKSKDGSK